MLKNLTERQRKNERDGKREEKHNFEMKKPK